MKYIFNNFCLSLTLVFILVVLSSGCSSNHNTLNENSSNLSPDEIENCIKGPFEGTCLENTMTPTCYRKPLDQKRQICGPLHEGENYGCAEGYSCYSMARSRVCCDYCPGEWSGSCLKE